MDVAGTQEQVQVLILHLQLSDLIGQLMTKCHQLSYYIDQVSTTLGTLRTVTQLVLRATTHAGWYLCVMKRTLAMAGELRGRSHLPCL
jgi:hypothetical protein